MSQEGPVGGPERGGHAPDCVVIATYKEAENLTNLIPRLLQVAPDFRIIVVDDNSPDGTPAMLNEMAAHERRLIPLIRGGKEGYGTAVLAGLNRALELGATRVATMDADFSHDPADVPSLFHALENADVAIGSRYYKGVRVLNWEVSRLILSLFANRYVKTILRFRVEDATSGFRAYRREAVEALTREGKIGSVGYSFLVEVLYFLYRRGFRLMEVPIVYTERRLGQTKMSNKVIFEAMYRPWLLRLKGLKKSGSTK